MVVPDHSGPTSPFIILAAFCRPARRRAAARTKSISNSAVTRHRCRAVDPTKEGCRGACAKRLSCSFYVRRGERRLHRLALRTSRFRFNDETLQRFNDVPSCQLASFHQLSVFSESSHPRHHSARPTGYHRRDGAGNERRPCPFRYWSGVNL